MHTSRCMPLLVTLGSDDFTSWVTLPNGERLNLGSISMVNFIQRTSPNKAVAKRSLAALQRGGEVIVPVEEDLMWDVFSPARTVYGKEEAELSFNRLTIPETLGEPPMTFDRTANMIDFSLLSNLEIHIQGLDKHASKVSPKRLAEGHQTLKRLVEGIKFAAQEEEEEAPKEAEEAEKEQEQETDKEASLDLDIVVANHELADSILDTAEQTVGIIDRLASEVRSDGRTFKASRARADVFAVTSKVAEIMLEDKSRPGVEEDLKKLAAEASRIRALFPATEPKTAASQNKTAGSSGYDVAMTLLGGEAKVGDAMEDLLSADEQTGELFQEIVMKISKELELSNGAQEALSRVQDYMRRGKTWDPSLVRNVIFKAANSLGIRLPSGMF